MRMLDIAVPSSTVRYRSRMRSSIGSGSITQIPGRFRFVMRASSVPSQGLPRHGGDTLYHQRYSATRWERWDRVGVGAGMAGDENYSTGVNMWSGNVSMWSGLPRWENLSWVRRDIPHMP